MAHNTKSPKITATTLKVLHMFLANHPGPLSGSDIFNETKVFSGTLYPILSRLETAGWLKATWEEINPSEAGRPRRRFYKLTSLGIRRAEAELNAFQFVSGRRPRPAAPATKGKPSWT